MATHKLMDGDLQVFKRTGRKHWQCAASIGGRQYRASTKEESLSLAKEIAKDWYLEKTGKSRAGLLRTEKTVKDAAEKFTREYEVITEGERSPKWVAGHQARLRLHLLPFFGSMGDLVKILWWDGQGLCMFCKRLERGKFLWPRAKDGSVSLTAAQLSMLLEGIDWRAPVRIWTPETAC